MKYVVRNNRDNMNKYILDKIQYRDVINLFFKSYILIINKYVFFGGSTFKIPIELKQRFVNVNYIVFNFFKLVN